MPLLVNAPVLAFPQDIGEYILDTDALDFGSKTLSGTEKRWCTTRKELCAVLPAVSVR